MSGTKTHILWIKNNKKINSSQTKRRSHFFVLKKLGAAYHDKLWDYMIQVLQ